MACTPLIPSLVNKMLNKGLAPKRGDILSLTKWIFLLGGIFGFWSFTVDCIEINKKSSYNVKMKLFDWCRALVVFTVYSSLTFCRLSAGFLFNHNFSFIEAVLNEFTMDSTMLALVLTIFMDIMNRHHLWKIIMTFSNMDKKVNVHIRPI